MKIWRKNMIYELAKPGDLQAVYNVVQHTIKTIYPKYYPMEVVDFFCEHHSEDAIAKAYIMNMYTAPEYRRQGFAFQTLDLLVKDAKEQGVLQIALEATDMGRPLYEKYGFVKMEDEMELKV